MAAPLPPYYSSLAPFQAAFARGNPILTYHKLGPRPSGTRLKGLYVSQALFERQLGELRDAGFSSAPLEHAPSPCAAPRIAITFDDGFTNALRHGLPALQRSGFRAIQFLVADRLGSTNDWDLAEGEVAEPLMSAAEVREWLAAGHDIGAHSLTHPWLTRIPVTQAREEIAAARKRLEDTFGRAVRHFCYPYGDHNPVVRDLVAEAGYLTACTTLPGVNLPDTDPFALRRFTARYASRNWANLVRWFRARF